MIRYACDLCGKELEPGSTCRYVVKIEVQQAFDPCQADEESDERDYLQEINEMLERMDVAELSDSSDEVTQQLRFDLCPSCRKKFLKDPLGRDALKQLNFSSN